MAVYKVIQNIEAEDKLLGPLTLKSFIYAAIAGLLAFINVRLLITGAPLLVKLVVVLTLFFPMLLFGVLASPLGRDQPTEVWLLSHIRFWLKNHQRVWDQSGTERLVTITAPKKIDRHLTDGLSQTEVESRLQALATTLDSRGWVVKNSTVSLGGQAGYLDESGGDSDRLVGTSSMPQQQAVLDVHAADDIMDEQNNATAQKFNQLMEQADIQRKQAIQDKLAAARQKQAQAAAAAKAKPQAPAQPKPVAISQPKPKPQMHAGQTFAPTRSARFHARSVPQAPDVMDAAEKLLKKQHARDAEIHRRSVGFKTKAQLAAERAAAAKAPIKEENIPLNTVTAAHAAAKLELAQSGNDLSVASIAHLANRTGVVQQISANEGVITLH